VSTRCGIASRIAAAAKPQLNQQIGSKAGKHLQHKSGSPKRLDRKNNCFHYLCYTRSSSRTLATVVVYFWQDLPDLNIKLSRTPALNTPSCMSLAGTANKVITT
jgi:hypothetical protein